MHLLRSALSPRPLNTLRTIVTLACAAVLAGCATTYNSDNPRAYLVVSTLGDTGRLEFSGTTVFQQWSRTYDTSDWNLDEAVEALVEAELRKNDRVTVVSADRAPYRERIGRALARRSLVGGSIRFEDGDEDALLELAQAAGADRILLIGTEEVDQYILEDVAGNLEAYGIWQRGLFGTKREYAFAVIDGWILEADNGRVVSSVPTLRTSSVARSSDVGRFSSRISGFTFVEKEQDLPQARTNTWRENVYPLLEEGLPDLVSRLRPR